MKMVCRLVPLFCLIASFILQVNGHNFTKQNCMEVRNFEWELTKSFLSLFNAKNLMIFCTRSGFPEANFISNTYKESKDNIQTIFMKLPLSVKLPDNYFGMKVPSVKLFLLENLDRYLKHLVELSHLEFYTTENVWLIRLESVLNSENIQRIFSELRLIYTSQVYIFAKDNNGIVIWELYKISSEDKTVQISTYGKWSPTTGLHVTNGFIWHRRINLNGLHFKAASLFNKPYVTEVASGCQDSTCFKGMFADVFHELQRVMNFTYTITIPEDGEWGRKRADGSWTGAIAMFDAGQVDIAPAEFTVTSLRGQIVDYLPSLDDPHMRFFIANPAESFNWYAYVRPFTPNSWLTIAFGVVIFSCLLSWIISKGKHEKYKSDFTLTQTFAFVSGTVLIRDWLSTPWTLRNKIAFFSMSFWGTLIYYHWEAMIISFLAVRTISLPFNSLEELLSETDLKILIQPGTSYIDAFRYGNTQTFQKAWRERIEPYLEFFPSSKAEMGEWIQNDKSYAMFDNYNVRRYYDDFTSCQTLDIPKKYFTVQFAMPIAKSSPYFQTFWFHTNALKEGGALSQIKERYQTEPQSCPNYSGKPLGFGQTFTAFVALIGGLATAGLLFWLELVLRDKKHLFASASSADALLNELEEKEREISRLEEAKTAIRRKLDRLKYN